MMRKTDYTSIGVLMLVPFLIFYPLFGAEYLYTDEAVQLRLYNVQDNFEMFTSQGRWITEQIFRELFQSISTVREITYLRLFSFFGWVLSIPIWYITLKKVVEQEGFPESLTFFTVLYMIVMPPFSIYVSWASCMELFLANTTGLLSGYFLYSNIRYTGHRIGVRAKGILLSLVFGLTSLFTYQTGFSCFLLPYFIHLLAHKKITRELWVAVGSCFAIYLLYFLLFKATVILGGISVNSRTGLHIDPLRKLKFFLFRPLLNAFRFTLIFSERSIQGFVMYGLIAGTWLVINFRRFREQPLTRTLVYFLALFILMLCMYIPGLIVRESYASNRTMFALNLAVFLMVVETIYYLVKERQKQVLVMAVLSGLFFINAVYNFRIVFLKPVTHEYSQLKAYVEAQYRPGVHTFYFIRPEEDFFIRRYGVNRTWDEMGVPSTFFNWVPESWTKQVIFEKTGNRQEAEKLVVKHWLGKKEFLQSGEQVGEGGVLVDVEQILSK